MRHPVLRYGAAALCVLGAVYFLLPLSMGVLHIGMLYPAAGLLLAAVWLVFPGLFRRWPRWLRRTVCEMCIRDSCKPDSVPALAFPLPASALSRLLLPDILPVS